MRIKYKNRQTISIKRFSYSRDVDSSGMCSSVILLLLLAQLGACDDSCSKLERRYRDDTDTIGVLVNGQEVETVVRGNGGAARAAAALLLVAIRYVRGYRASMNTTFVQMCDFFNISELWEAAVVAPAVTWHQEECNKQGSFDLLANFSGSASVTYDKRLWAYVNSSSCLSKALQWSFFINDDKFQECGFKKSKNINLKSNRYTDNYYAVLVRNESSNDNEIASELQRRFEASSLKLQIEYFESDFLMRKKISELKNLGNSFLFLDENIWSDAKHMINVEPPSSALNCITCSSPLSPIGTFRFGNGMFMNKFAPPISKLVNNFSPNASHLRQILEIETAKNQSHIEDAACFWALKHEKEFENMISYDWSKDRSEARIKYILCEGDPFNTVFENVTTLVNQLFSKEIHKDYFKIYKRLINCLNEDSFTHTMESYIKQPNIAGIISWSTNEGIVSAAKVAERGHLPLFLVGPVAPEVTLGPSVRAATGLLTDLSRALHYLLNICEWSRIAILSDNSAYSKSFVVTMSEQQKLLYRNEIVNYKNIDLHLNELEKANAGIFLLNVNWNISCQILCAALKRGMTPRNGFVWIARDWRPIECCNNYTWDSMYHYTINFGWQEEYVENSRKRLKNNLTELSKITGTTKEIIIHSDSLILADALIQLVYGFDKFHNKNRPYRYSLGSSESTLLFSNILKDITGVQNLKSKNFTLKNPLVFIHKWQGVIQTQKVGIFQIFQNKVLIKSPINATCMTLFGNQLIRNIPSCGTIYAGDPFSPRCHDDTVLIIAVCLFLLAITLYMVRRIRLKLLLARELNIMASLLEIRQHTATSLDMYLVNRNAIKLLHEIGSGTFGLVHFAELQRPGKGTVVVAAKEPRKDIGPTEECEFFHEACVLAPLCHDNIIKLVGICIMNGPPIVLMEHAFYLDLKRYLTERRHLVSSQPNDNADDRSIEVSDESLTRLACEAAGALTYLTTRRLVHRDVRAANCLIDKKRSLKLGDFGMARELDVKAPEYATIRRALFPVLWMAPESLQLGVFSFATDIWSLGVLIMEVVTLGARPYGDWQPTRVLNYVTSGGFPPLPPDISKQTSSLLHSCWEPKAELRPSASWVHKYLTQNPRALSPALLNPYPPDPPIISVE